MIVLLTAMIVVVVVLLTVMSVTVDQVTFLVLR